MGAALVALWLTACGGLSVRHDEPDAGIADMPAAGKSSSPPSTAPSSASSSGAGNGATAESSAACLRVCKMCVASPSTSSCDAFCTSILSAAADAGCSAALASLLKCQDANQAGCATELCPTQNNALTACILEYCDSYPTATVCESAL